MLILLYEILTAAVVRALADGPIAAVVGTKVYNNVPKDSVAPPYLMVRFDNSEDLPDKTETFTSGELIFDYWVNADSGDIEVLKMVDYITTAFNNIPLVLSLGSTNLLMTRTRYNVFLESDGLSRHGVINFNLMIED